MSDKVINSMLLIQPFFSHISWRGFSMSDRFNRQDLLSRNTKYTYHGFNQQRLFSPQGVRRLTIQN